MKKTKGKQLAASFAICGLCIATAVFGSLAVIHTPTVKGLQSYAGGFVTVDTENIGEGTAVGITELTENFFNPNVGYGSTPSDILMPGSSRSGNITFQNDSADTKVKLKFWAQSTPEQRSGGAHDGDKPYEIYASKNTATAYDAEHLKAASDKLVNDYMDLVIKNPNGTTVYSGKVSGPGTPIEIGEIEPGKTSKYTFTLTVPAKSLESFARDESDEETLGLDHGYDNTVAMIDWYFSAEIVKDKTVSTTSATGSTTTTKAPPPPNTGEEPNMYLFAAIACGVSALVMFYVTFYGGQRKRKEEED